MAKRLTPLARWMAEQNLTVAELATELGEGRGRISFYVRGDIRPRADMLRKLTARTGLPSDAFLFPFEWRAA